jgi:hypothetical protein
VVSYEISLVLIEQNTCTVDLFRNCRKKFSWEDHDDRGGDRDDDVDRDEVAGAA